MTNAARDPHLRSMALQAKAWPFEEARKLVERFKAAPPAKGYVLLETGYGPSGLPHIGTFGEVARTSMVRHAFEQMSDLPTRLFAFSDDMDGLRKVPDNIPNKEMVTKHLGKPLTQVPDPFGKFESFGHHNNAMLRDFLDRFGFRYEFKSATEEYRSGRLDATLLKVLAHYDAIMEVMLPTLGEERQRTYSPFLPVSAATGRVLQVPVIERDVKAGTIVFEDEDGKKVETPVTGGRCKLQWKVDWAMRWVALDVDYEMAGKDLIPSVELSSKIAKILGARPPEGFNYELFLDEKGQKISKSKGNGLTIEEWLRYAPPESLALYMFQQPKRAKRLYFDVIPRAVDEYLSFLDRFAAIGKPSAKADAEAKPDGGKVPADPALLRLENPAWHIHGGAPPAPLELAGTPISFGMLLNLASACNAGDKGMLWGFLSRYAPGVTAATHPKLDELAGYAVAYFHDFVKPAKTFRAPTDVERKALEDLAAALPDLPDEAGKIQDEVYAIGKRHPFADLKDWFRALYEVLLGQSQGPRFGSFAALYGRAETAALIKKALAGELASAA
ncbi:MAG: lysine--tRNA ligase [Alphaproteobacteria bacterium]|nr:lysine--tRNA ligase [Alphaproteobacteria bacterium]